MAPGVPQRTPTDDSMHVSNFPAADDGVSSNLRKYVGNGLLAPRKSVDVVGVMLVDRNQSGGKSEVVGAPVDGKSVVLGTVCLENVKVSLEEMRRFMCAELPCLPANFSFLTKEGWPVARQQEHKVNASHAIKDNKCICISKEFEKSRVAIVTSTGDNLGFVFTDLNINIKQLRDIVEQQLRVTQQSKLEYRFLERNGWPILSSQESVLSLLDIIMENIVYIHNGDKHANIAPSHHPRPVSLMYSPSNVGSDFQHSPTQEVAEHEPVKRKKSLKFLRPETQLSFKSRKSASEKLARKEKDELSKPILISYVRNEAVQYALDLKQELGIQGYSVYLDVHEIKTGSDWQDALNNAVTNCHIFIPLITPNYGKTQWTNREIKLADVLGKVIIPINFMEHWPPPCLAIQFASTQYIPWKNQDIDHVKEPEKPSDSKCWDPVCIKRVSRQIAEVFKDEYIASKLPKRSPSCKETPYSKPQLSPREDIYTLVSDCAELSAQRIVISAHPRQRYLAQDLKSMFEKSGHEVWCSVEMMDNLMNLGSEDTGEPNTPRNLPTIQEGDVFFNQNDLEMYSSVGEKKSQSLYRDQEPYGRRPLSRLMSQFSDISQPSTISKEKLDMLKTFQQKVDQAVVVIVLVSEAYTKSTFSHQQVFYCEHRKRVVMVKCDASPIPKWFRLLMGNDMIMKVNNPQFECVLKARVKRMINPSSAETPKDAAAEAKLNYLVKFFKHNLPLQEVSVYITGSSKLQTPRAEEICKAIGSELAKLERVCMVTGGFFGAADITAKTFYECRENNIIQEESTLVHILPMMDSEDLSAKARQNPDGTFEGMPFGKNFFLGDSVKERETVVARLLDTCVVIEGGPGVVHEIEEFIWNDHFVIPIMSTGGAAGGQYGVPVRIFEVPPGVDDVDWSVLSEKEASPSEVARAVVNILVSLKKNLSSTPTPTLQRPHPPLKRKSRRKRFLMQKKEDEEETDRVTPMMAPHTVRGVFNFSEMSQSSSDVVMKKRSWWRRFLRLFKRRNRMD